ncbi:TrmH family RNA methyltransferase [Oceanivirga salmonicida]|uniref:TrmH family RNA methyltransferase n=1 Tax=Oceanivirga salmonicida TaxID=1769291 RepID=UPI000AF80F37|nr:RNA methyltransferase [Oceanivirga salmonicida]
MEQKCNIVFIESKDNKNYKLIKKLSKKKYRDENNIFIAEGEKFFEQSNDFNQIVINESYYDYYNKEYDLKKYNKIIVLKENLFKEISTQEHSQGIIFIYSKFAKNIHEISGDIVILDDIQDPGNAGTIIRTLVALNYQNLILTKGSVDVYAPKVIRASMGAIFNINVIYEEPNKIIDFINLNKYECFATALSDTAKDYRELKLKIDKNAYVFGHEGGGVSKKFLDISKKAIIPISDKVNSLNVGVALAVFLYKMREIGGEI